MADSLSEKFESIWQQVMVEENQYKEKKIPRHYPLSLVKVYQGANSEEDDSRKPSTRDDNNNNNNNHNNNHNHNRSDDEYSTTTETDEERDKDSDSDSNSNSNTNKRKNNNKRKTGTAKSNRNRKTKTKSNSNGNNSNSSTKKKEKNKNLLVPNAHQEEKWMNFYHQLKDFHKKNGHCRASRSQQPKLGSWVKCQVPHVVIS